MPFTTAPCIFANDLADFHHPRLALNLRRLQRAGAVLREYAGEDSGILRNIYTLKAKESGSLFADPRRIELLLAMGLSARDYCNIFTSKIPTLWLPR